jgi:hypothetical protein
MNEITSTDIANASWIEQLAIEEINMDESGIVHINDHLNPAAFLEESSIRFMDMVRDRFELYSARFNEYRGGAARGAQIKIFKISNTVNDFMLFRNSLRLVITRKANDLITISFLGQGKDYYSPRAGAEDSFGATTAHEIRAHIGAFNKITWRFQGEPVDIEAMTKHYISEFIRNSAR